MEEKKRSIVSDSEKPKPNDVLFGRGTNVNRHKGNVRFRRLVLERKKLYTAVKKHEKDSIAREIGKAVVDSGGRFLSRKSWASAEEKCEWGLADEKTVLLKIKQALRDTGRNPASAYAAEEPPASLRREGINANSPPDHPAHIPPQYLHSFSTYSHADVSSTAQLRQLELHQNIYPFSLAERTQLDMGSPALDIYRTLASSQNISPATQISLASFHALSRQNDPSMSASRETESILETQMRHLSQSLQIQRQEDQRQNQQLKELLTNQRAFRAPQLHEEDLRTRAASIHSQHLALSRPQTQPNRIVGLAGSHSGLQINASELHGLGLPSGTLQHSLEGNPPHARTSLPDLLLLEQLRARNPQFSSSNQTLPTAASPTTYSSPEFPLNTSGINTDVATQNLATPSDHYTGVDGPSAN